MHFDLNDDQKQLQALVERFGGDRYDLERRRSYQAQPTGFCAENWSLLGELGILSLPFAEASEGLGGSPVDLIVAFEALGRSLAVEPTAEASILAGGAFEQGAGPVLRETWLSAIVSGRRRLALAHVEHGARDNLAWVETRFEHRRAGFRLNGAKAAIPYGVGADAFLITARAAGAPPDGAEGMETFLVTADAPGLKARARRMIDGAPCLALTLENVEVSEDARLSGGRALIEDAMARYVLATSAEALGLMETIFAATLDFMRTRRQFGAALASFQALQHRMAAQYVALEQARSLLYLAALTAPEDRQLWLRNIAGARAFITDAALNLGHESIQIHGGMGVSDELAIGHAHRRLFAISRYPASPQAALDAFAGAPENQARAFA